MFFNNEELTVEQRQMYAAEKLVNFRFIAKLLGTRSHHVLTSADLAPLTLQSELSIFSQFAEVAYSVVPVKLVFEKLDVLSGTGFPLEGYDALKDSVFVDAVRGEVADVPAYVAYRPQLKQLVVAFSGTASFSQVIQDLRASKTPYPRPSKESSQRSRCAVHTGFWKLYEGIGSAMLKIVKGALEKFEVEEIVLTGHSMGGVLCYLLAMDLLVPGADVLSSLTKSMRWKIVAFGSPRWANDDMARYWTDTVRAYRAQHGEGSLLEFSVKGLNDGKIRIHYYLPRSDIPSLLCSSGVPALPPTYLGYRHVCETPLYFTKGNLYRIPTSEREHAFFSVDTDSTTSSEPVRGRTASTASSLPSSASTGHHSGYLHPRGGHNYYSERDMEKMQRRMRWLHGVMSKEGEANWREHYLRHLAAHEGGKTISATTTTTTQNNNS